MNLISCGAFRHLMLVEIVRNLAISSRTGRNSDNPIYATNIQCLKAQCDENQGFSF